jgi:hypothetical protein
MENIKMDLSEIVWDGVDWIGMAQDRDQWTALGCKYGHTVAYISRTDAPSTVNIGMNNLDVICISNSIRRNFLRGQVEIVMEPMNAL